MPRLWRKVMWASSRGFRRSEKLNPGHRERSAAIQGARNRPSALAQLPTAGIAADPLGRFVASFLAMTFGKIAAFFAGADLRRQVIVF
jgi:hypothetical protein